MQSVKSSVTKSLPVGSMVDVCDNSGAKVIKITNVRKVNTVKGKLASAGVGDLIMGSVKKGKPDMKKKVVLAVVVRQKKEYRRVNGKRIKFEDNAVVVVKDDKGNPQGTAIKGVVSKESTVRWPAISKLANIVV
ncbi:MAG: uL14 family ribosomal protein [Candidatus Woesearchaeota archaeon]